MHFPKKEEWVSPLLSKKLKSLAEFAAEAANKVKVVFGRGMYVDKTHLRLQVWNLSAYGRQIMRAADCKKLAEKAEGLFRQDKPADSIGGL